MKKVFTLLVLIAPLALLKAQYASQQDSLFVNDYNAMIYSNGWLTGDTITHKGGQKINRGGVDRSITYATDLWISGMNSVTGDTSLWESTYGQNPRSEGPVADSYGASWSAKYKKLWKISKVQIDHHKANFWKSSYTMPNDIATWPAHGDTTNGEDFYLAPFIDWDKNGMYNPEAGDYPCIKGDMAIYTISNDDRLSNNRWNKFPLEVHMMMYAFTNTNDVLEQTLFTEFKIVNRSNAEYTDMIVGFHQDFDLGCSDDDYVGTDTNLNVFYVYNGDRYDEDCRGINGHDSIIPFAGTVILNHDLMSTMLYERGLNPYIGDPVIQSHYYNYLNARWKDGEHLVRGGVGHPMDTNATNQKTNFVFPSDPRDSLEPEWNEQIAKRFPFDRRIIGSVGKFDLLPGEYIELSAATVVSFDENKYGVDYLDVFDQFQDDVQYVQDYFDNNIGYCQYWLTEIDTPMSPAEFKIWPIPTDNDLNIIVSGMQEQKDYELQVLNVNGQVVIQSFLRNNERNTIDVSSLKKGMYFLHMKNEDEVRVEKVLIE